jgi:hypothetical protein
MRIQLIAAFACATFVSANITPASEIFLAPHLNSLAEDTLNLPYSKNLACGGCIRSGYVFCGYKDGKKCRDDLDVCCNKGDFECMFSQTKKDTRCATQNQTFHDENQDTTEYYKDRYVMVQKFCLNRQDSSVCCPKKKFADGSVMNLKEDGKCKIEIKNKNKNESANFTLYLDKLPYGGSCTYEVKTKCGYPRFGVNNSNIDMVVAYKKQKFDDDKYEPLDDDTYGSDETFNPTYKNGKIIFQMDKKVKKDDDDGKNETKCKSTKIYVTLTNKINPEKPPKSLATSNFVSLYTEVSDAGSPNIALIETNATDASVLLSFTMIDSFVVMFSAFLI